jgi:hypothetical protein
MNQTYSVTFNSCLLHFFALDLAARGRQIKILSSLSITQPHLDKGGR